jgi:hypothetical protein
VFLFWRVADKLVYSKLQTGRMPTGNVSGADQMMSESRKRRSAATGLLSYAAWPFSQILCAVHFEIPSEVQPYPQDLQSHPLTLITIKRQEVIERLVELGLDG